MARHKSERVAAAPDETTADANERLVNATNERNVVLAEEVSSTAGEEGRLPATSAIVNPAPTTRMVVASGAFVEEALVAAVPADHPAVENNPRMGTSAIQNGADFNEPFRREPTDPKFAGQGLDLTVYGAAPKA